MDQINKVNLGRKINSIRIGRKETLEEFANQIKLKTDNKVMTTKSNVSKWEKGQNMPNDLTLNIIADLGNVTAQELLYGEPKTYLDNLLFNSKLLNDFSTIVFDKFYEDLESSASSEEDLYLSEEEAAKRYKRFSEQMKLDDHVDYLGSSIHLAYENRGDSNLVQMYLNGAHNEYSLLFGKSPEDANNDIKRKKKE